MNVAAFSQKASSANPWPALAAICIGFFMLLVDATIVTVAVETLQRELQADINMVMWVTSAYLLATAVPLMITGRLGDRLGPKRLYISGLALFTGASLWCGLTTTVEMLILARVFQGLGAAMISPQTMTIITRVFPTETRGKAVGIWGSVAGAATLVGPMVGGIILDSLGWQWIFFVNVPVGVLGLFVAVRFIPALPQTSRSLDWLGVVLSGLGVFLLAFGIQEGPGHQWGDLVFLGVATSVPALLFAGVAITGAFLAWQAWGAKEPLVPLSLFSFRNYSLANIAVVAMGFAVLALNFPLMIFLQAVLGLSPAQSALVLVPSSVVSFVLSPIVGNWADRLPPRPLAAGGIAIFILSSVALVAMMRPGQNPWLLILPMLGWGVAASFTWTTLSAVVVQTLPLKQAGAGSGVYNTTRAMGNVLGSAVITSVMVSRLQAYGVPALAGPESGNASLLSAATASGVAQGLAEALIVPIIVLVAGFLAALFLQDSRTASLTGSRITKTVAASTGSEAE